MAGPYLSFGGAILAEAFVVETFTDYIYLGNQSFPHERYITLSRIFAAVAKAMVTLRRYYETVELSTSPVLGRLFPQPTYVDNKGPEEKLTVTDRFDIAGQKSDDLSRTLFRGMYHDQKVFVKFCQRYHGDGHRLVAAAGYAPKLFFCEKIRGGLVMVIMGLVDGKDAFSHEDFKDKPLPEELLNDIERAVDVLHQVQLVFGDLRRPNVMIEGTGTGVRLRALLVDFEWVGHEDQQRYPGSLNEEIQWANGVRAHGLMKKLHDLEMIDLQLKYKLC